MTPQEHITRAEEILNGYEEADTAVIDEVDVANVLSALVHVGIAIAVELGAPHASGDSASPSSAH